MTPTHNKRQSVSGTVIKTLVIDVVRCDKQKSHFWMDKYSVGGVSELLTISFDLTFTEVRAEYYLQS